MRNCLFSHTHKFKHMHLHTYTHKHTCISMHTHTHTHTHPRTNTHLLSGVWPTSLIQPFKEVVGRVIGPNEQPVSTKNVPLSCQGRNTVLSDQRKTYLQNTSYCELHLFFFLSAKMQLNYIYNNASNVNLPSGL